MCGCKGSFSGGKCKCKPNCNCASCQLKKFKQPTTQVVNQEYFTSMLPQSYWGMMNGYSESKSLYLDEELKGGNLDIFTRPPEKELVEIAPSDGHIKDFKSVEEVVLIDENGNTHPLVRPGTPPTPPTSSTTEEKEPVPNTTIVIGSQGNTEDILTSTIGITSSGPIGAVFASGGGSKPKAVVAQSAEKKKMPEWLKYAVGAAVVFVLLKFVK